MTNMGDSIRRRQGGRPRAKKPAVAGTRARGAAGPELTWWHWIAGGLGGALAAFGIGYLFAVFVLFPKPALARDEVAVPELQGMSVEEARDELSQAQLVVGNVSEMVHPSARAGDIVAQDPLAGQRLRPGAVVHVAVSRGRARVSVPSLEGMPADAAIELAQRVGFEVERVEEASEVAGTVLRTEPAGGTQSELPARLRVFVGDGSIVPVDTTPAQPADPALEPARPGDKLIRPELEGIPDDDFDAGDRGA